MLHAKVTTPFPGAPDGSRETVNWKEGDIVKGELAKVAIENGWAKEHKSSEPARTKGDAGSNDEKKSGAASQQDQASQKKTASKSGSKK